MNPWSRKTMTQKTAVCALAGLALFAAHQGISKAQANRRNKPIFIDGPGDENRFVSTVRLSLRDALVCSEQRQASQGADCCFLSHGFSGPWIHGELPLKLASDMRSEERRVGKEC